MAKLPNFHRILSKIGGTPEAEQGLHCNFKLGVGLSPAKPENKRIKKLENGFDVS